MRRKIRQALRSILAALLSCALASPVHAQPAASGAQAAPPEPEQAAPRPDAAPERAAEGGTQPLPVAQDAAEAGRDTPSASELREDSAPGSRRIMPGQMRDDAPTSGANAQPREANGAAGTLPDALDDAAVSGTIGGMPEGAAEYEYTSPLKRIGLNLALGTYALGALVSLLYLVYVYPAVRLFGGTYFQTVMPWLLVPVVGPWMAQYEGAVKDQPVWRAVFIADAGLQAAGVLIGLLGVLLSGQRETPSDVEPEQSVELDMGASGLTLTVRM